MTKKLKLSFIFYGIFCCVLIAFKSLTTFFSGAGIPFMALTVMLFLNLMLMLQDKFVYGRTKDLFVISCVFNVLEIMLFFVLDFPIGDFDTWKWFLGFQNVLTLFGIVFFAYLGMRIILEVKGIKLNFVEVLLGNAKPVKKAKKDKEISNGALEEKPNAQKNAKENEQETDEQNNEDKIQTIEELDNEDNVETDNE